MSKLHVLKENSFQEDFMNNITEWFSAHKNSILITILALFVGILFCYRFFSSREEKAEKEYLRADTLYNQFEANSLKPNSQEFVDSLNNLEKMVNTIPELHAKYDGAIAQLLLLDGQLDRAKPFAEATLKRTESDELENYQDFSKTTLIIAAGDYTQALQKSKELNEELKQSQETFPVLYAFNLVRMAMLHQKLDQKDQEKIVWNEIFNNITPGSKGYTALNQVFKQGETSLYQYLQQRLGN